METALYCIWMELFERAVASSLDWLWLDQIATLQKAVSL
jgi:hypothetical protein